MKSIELFRISSNAKETEFTSITSITSFPPFLKALHNKSLKVCESSTIKIFFPLPNLFFSSYFTSFLFFQNIS